MDLLPCHRASTDTLLQICPWPASCAWMQKPSLATKSKANHFLAHYLEQLKWGSSVYLYRRQACIISVWVRESTTGVLRLHHILLCSNASLWIFIFKIWANLDWKVILKSTADVLGSTTPKQKLCGWAQDFPHIRAADTEPRTPVSQSLSAPHLCSVREGTEHTHPNCTPPHLHTGHTPQLQSISYMR